MPMLLRSLGMAIGLIAIGLCVLLLCVCRTGEGVLFAVAGINLGLVPVLVAVGWERSRRLFLRCALGAFVAWAAVTVVLCVRSPEGHSTANARVQHRYTNGQWHFRRWVLGNLLPEVDQFMLGFKLVPAVDPFFTLKQSHTVSALTASIYRELEADPDFHALGSVMPNAYDEIWKQPFDHGHCFLYNPPTSSAAPRPAIVFLHGSGGNFKSYTWIMKQIADEVGMFIIAPSYGMGNWREPDTSRVIREAIKDASKVTLIDQHRLHLIGLSNGGLGVSQAASQSDQPFRSLTFLSPVFERMALGSPAFTDQWRGHPILVITGTHDERVPFDYVQNTVEMLKASGVQSQFHAIEGADHFMLFSHRADVVKTLTDWLRAQQATRPSP
jgi:pimeloyl-ACP methyl ester carboxylesterase